MKFLAFDTSSEVLTIVIADKNQIVDCYQSEDFFRHSEVLIPTIDNIFKKNRLAAQDIDVFVACVGPGSFTGLRVGIATAKMLAFSLNKKLASFSSLEALAISQKELGGQICVAQDARKGQVYAATYILKNGNSKILSKPKLALMDEVIKSIKTPTTIVGSAVKIYHDRIKKNAHCKMNENSHSDSIQVSSVVSLALRQITQKKFIDPFKLEPEYLYSRDCNVIKK